MPESDETSRAGGRRTNDGERSSIEVIVTAWCEWEELDPDRSTGSFMFYGYRETKGFIALSPAGGRHEFRLQEVARESEGDFEVEELDIAGGFEPASIGMDRWDFERTVARRAGGARTYSNMQPPPLGRFRWIHVRIGSPLEGEELTNAADWCGRSDNASRTMMGIRALEGPDAEGVFRVLPTSDLVECLEPRATHFFVLFGKEEEGELVVQLIACNVDVEPNAEDRCNEVNREFGFGLRAYGSPRTVHLMGALSAVREQVASTFTLLWNEALARIAPGFPGVARSILSDQERPRPVGGTPKRGRGAKIARLLLSDDEASVRQAFELLATLGEEAPWDTLEAGIADEDREASYMVSRVHAVAAGSEANALMHFRVEKRSPCERSREALFAANLDNLWSRSPIRSCVDEHDGVSVLRHAIDVVASAGTLAPRLAKAWLALRAFEPQHVDVIQLDG